MSSEKYARVAPLVLRVTECRAVRDALVGMAAGVAEDDDIPYRECLEQATAALFRALADHEAAVALAEQRTVKMVPPHDVASVWVTPGEAAELGKCGWKEVS